MADTKLSRRCRDMFGLIPQGLMADRLVIIKIIPADDGLMSGCPSKFLQLFLVDP